MRYKCLVLDHDDTVVNSTATIHFPSFLAYLARVRPGAQYTLEEYFRKNFDPGVVSLFTDELGFSPEEIAEEFAFWQEYVKTRVPGAYPGIREILERHRAAGGLIAVISHSVSANILRDYRENSLPEPELVYGWEVPKERRKPQPYALFDIMEKLHFAPGEMLVLDDLKPGYDMARAANVPFAAALWSNDIPEIEAFMRGNCGLCFKTVAQFRDYLFSGKEA